MLGRNRKMKLKVESKNTYDEWDDAGCVVPSIAPFNIYNKVCIESYMHQLIICYVLSSLKT